MVSIRTAHWKTVAGDTKILSMRLNCPSEVVVDANRYLFIVDSGNNRIIRSNSNTFYCVIGCSTVRGSESDQFDEPTAIAFDNVGNIFVADSRNYRVQKFMLMTDTAGM